MSFQNLIEKISASRSPSDPNTSLQKIERGYEFGAEGVLIALALYYALRASNATVRNISVEPLHTQQDKTTELRGLQELIAQFRSEMDTSHQAGNGLYSAWESSYHKSREVRHESKSCDTDEDGVETCTTDVWYTTEWYWDEPVELTNAGLNYRQIVTWRDMLANISTKSRTLLNTLPTIPILDHKAESYRYPVTEVSQPTTDITRLLLSGGIVGFFGFYEEFVSFLQNRYGFEQMNELMVKRRSLFKLLLGGLALSQTDTLRTSVRTQNSSILDQTYDGTTATMQHLNRSDEDKFATYMGIGRVSILLQLDSMIDRLQNGSTAGKSTTEDWNSIKPHLEALLSAATALKDHLVTFFQSGDDTSAVPHDLAEIMGRATVDQNVRSIVAQQNAEVNNLIWVETLQLLGTLGLGAIGIELINWLSDEAIDRLR